MASLIEDNAVRWKIRQGGLPEYQRVSTLGKSAAKAGAREIPRVHR